jgi:hypothetical protein
MIRVGVRSSRSPCTLIIFACDTQFLLISDRNRICTGSLANKYWLAASHWSLIMGSGPMSVGCEALHVILCSSTTARDQHDDLQLIQTVNASFGKYKLQTLLITTLSSNVIGQIRFLCGKMDHHANSRMCFEFVKTSVGRPVWLLRLLAAPE